MLQFSEKSIVVAVRVVEEVVHPLHSRICKTIKEVQVILPRVVPAGTALITETRDPVAAQVILRVQRVTVGVGRRKIQRETGQGEGRAAYRQVGSRIKYLTG